MLTTLNPEWVGLLAAIFTTTAYVPQVPKVLREKHTTSISLIMYMMSATGIIIWFVYGLLIGSTSILISNIVTFILVMSIIFMKLKHG